MRVLVVEDEIRLAENVARALRQGPSYAVDTASGTEGAPGRKDPERLRAFFQAVEGGPVAAPTVGQPA